jgi:redox-sensitive bicupin YhaK (pirin superfamily)
MIDIRPFATLGHADHGWLDARHHFSFANYHDPDRMGWGSIRVWNDDTIAAQSGFPPHPHRDMEIVTFVRSGAGTGITHAEMNREDEATTLFQIWIIPDRQGEQPGWGQRTFPKATREGGFEVLASGDAEADDALPIRTDAKVAAATLAKGQSAVWNTSGDRHQYLVAPKGRVTVNGREAQPRDGIAVTGESEIVVEALDDAEIVLVDAR